MGMSKGIRFEARSNWKVATKPCLGRDLIKYCDMRVSIASPLTRLMLKFMVMTIGKFSHPPGAWRLFSGSFLVSHFNAFKSRLQLHFHSPIAVEMRDSHHA